MGTPAPKAKQVKVRGQDGGEWWIPEEDLPASIKAGFSPVLEAEKRPGLAFGVGVARTLSMGATDYGMVDLDPDAATGAKGLKEAHGGATMAGEIAGAAPTALLTGGTGSIVTQTVGKTALRGAVESVALNSLQPAVTEAALERKELTAESIAKHAAAAALGGFVIAGAGASVGKMFQKGSEAVANSALLSRAESMAGDEARTSYLKGLINRAGDLKKHGLEERWDDIVKFGDSEGVFAARDLRGVSEAAAAVNQKYQSQLDDLLAQIDAVNPAARTAKRDSSGAVVGSVLADEFRDSAGYKAARALGDESLMPWEAAAKKLDDLFKLPDRTWKAVDRVGIEGKGVYVRVGQGAQGKTVEIADEIRNIIGQRANRDLGLPTEVVDELKDKISMSWTLKDNAHDRFIEANSQMASAGQLGLPGMVIFGARRAVKYAGTVMGRGAFQGGEGSMLVSRALKSISQNKVLTRGAGALRDTVSALLEGGAVMSAPLRIALERAATEGGAEFLEAHTQLATGPHGEEYKQVMGLPSGPVQGIGAKLDTLGNVQEGTDDVVGSLEASAGKFIGGSLRGGKLGVGDFDSTVKSLKDALKNPEALFDQLPDHLKNHAPTTSMMATGKGVEALRFLDSKVPRGPYGPNVMQAMRPEYHPSPAEKARFMRYVEAVANPDGVFAAMAQGKAPREHVEVMKALYPETLNQIGQALFTELAKLEKPLDYRKRIALANTFGFDAVGMSAPAAQVVQLSHAKAKEEQKQAGGAPQNDGRQMTNTTKNLETQAQRMEAR